MPSTLAFSDVTRAAGLWIESYGMGGAAADYDNDGKVGLYLSCLGPNRLYRTWAAGSSRT